MSDLGYQSTPYRPEPARPPDGDIPAWVLYAAIGVLIFGMAVVALVLLNPAADKEAKASYPDSWDPRIAPYVKIVEKQRGLTFLHPVAVRFRTGAEFEKGVRADEADLDAEDRKEIEHGEGLFRALGLVTGDIDLFAAFNDAHGSGTLAYYSSEDQRITVRGKQLRVASRATLVHELTHALQDQHFAIGERLEKLRKAAEKGANNSEVDVFDAIVEGDAERVSTLYRSSLKPAQRKRLAAAEQASQQGAQDDLTKVPEVVLTFIGAPYTLGQAMVQAVAEDGGNHAIDGIMRNTPTHDAALLDPFQILAGQTEAAVLTTPKLADGEKKFDSGEFGAVSWYLVLAERLPMADALTAADGWNGDAYVSFQRAGQACARIGYRGDAAADTDRMFSALQRWIAAAPGSGATVRRETDDLLFETCDPGKKARVGKDVSSDAVGLAATRTYLAVGIMHAGAPKETARCLAGAMAREYSLAQLSNPRFGANDPSIKARVKELAESCR